MLSKTEEYELVKAMVRELAELPSLPQSLVPGFLATMKGARQHLSPWAAATDKDMQAALRKARECLAGKAKGVPA